MNDDILTIPEVADLLRVTEKTVYTLAQRSEIPAFKVGGQWRFSRAAINDWIEARTCWGDAAPSSKGREEVPPGSRRSRKGR